MNTKTFKLKAIDFFRELLSCLWLFFPGVVTIIGSFFLFTKLSIGQDIIIQVSEYAGPRFFSFIAICFWAYVIWYSARIVSYKKGKDATNSLKKAFLTHFPRLMAFNAFVSIETAILGLPGLQKLIGVSLGTTGYVCELVLFIVAQNCIYLLINLVFGPGYFHKQRNKTLLIILIAAILGWWALLLLKGLESDKSGEPGYPAYLSFYAIFLFLLQLLFTWAFIMREHYIRKNHKTHSRKIQELNLKLTNGTHGVNEARYFIWFNILSFIGIVIYFASILSISFANKMGPLAVVLTAFGFLIGMASIISYLSIRYRINFFFILLAILFISGIKFDPYKVRTLNQKPAIAYNERNKVCTYFYRWLNHPDRKALIDAASPEHPFDIYLVMSDGGASRSGYWVSSVLSAMEDCTRKDPTRRFSNHLFCMSSASGGSVGNTTFYSIIHHNGAAEYTPAVQNFLRTDFLSFLMARYFGPDTWGHLFGVFDDRAAALERVMEGAADSMYTNAYKYPFDHFMDTTGRLPVLFINTTEVQHGMPSVVSTAQLDFSKRYDVVQIADTSSTNPYNNLRMSTAAVLSSRFPYISPAGELGGYYFVDGGYFDNSGAGVVHEMMLRLDSLMTAGKGEDSMLYSKLRFRLIHITNGSDSSKPKGQINAFVNTLAAPIVAVLGTYGSQTDVNNDRLNQYFRSKNSPNYVVDKEINLYRPHETEEYPMNWVISNYNLRRMNSRLEEVIQTFKTTGRYGLLATDSFHVYDLHKD
ncbi:MAG: patatin-like phospholipase family protein [Chitinophaga sp.]|uniref:patatin-like phospholipase family protein n=1 Tax=Chitinophaga sp. TaxID=1869181 RepID=UPI0025C13011|nr:patatin-like phospholipase family protein [Chitinophaga sp.]MBV8254140.1 patatin-like phospholipase family protein [Chitinophaga sp.]